MRFTWFNRILPSYGTFHEKFEQVIDLKKKKLQLMDSESRTGQLGQLFHLKKSSTYTYKMLVSSYNTLNVLKPFTSSHCKQSDRKTWSPTYELILI